MNIQALIAQGLITDVASVDPNKAYVAVGIFQPGNRPAGSANANSYPSYAIPISEFLAAGGIYTGSNGIALVGNDFQLASLNISQFTNDSAYITTAALTGYVQGLGTIGYVPRWNLTDTLGNSVIFDDGLGKVGIGTITPGATLDIKPSGPGTVGININTAGVQDATITFGINNNTYPSVGGFRTKVYVASAGESFNIYTANNDTIFWNGIGAVQSKTLTLFTDTTAKFENNLGVGVTAVSNTRLHVKGIDATSANYALKIDNSASSSILYVRNDGNVYSHGVGGIVTNTAFGLNSLLSNLTGSDNTVYGVNAMRVNTTGTNNTAVGVNALYNSNGSFNTATGYISLESNTGDRNTAFGYGSLSVNTTGIRNTAVGMFAGNVNSVGDDNVFIGYNANALSNNLTNAIAIGYNATVSSSNSMVLGEGVNVGIGIPSPAAKLHIKGVYATSANYALKVDNSAAVSLFSVRNDGFSTILDMTIGRGGGLISTNTVLGVSAIANASGGQNTGIGFAVLNTLSSGASNTAIGYAVLANVTTGTTNVGIGAGVMQASNPSYSIGIGGGVLYQSSGTGNTGIGHGNFYNLSSGNYNTALGYNAGANAMHTQGTNNLFLGYMADISVDNLTNAIAIGANATVGASNSMVLGNGVNVAIGLSVPDAKLHVKGSDTSAATYALKIDNSTPNALFYIKNNGLISAPLLQTGNAGLATGDLYVDTAANILANGDLVVGWKV